MGDWASIAGIEAKPIDDEALLFLSGIATGLLGTTTSHSAEDSREVGAAMIRLLGHIAALESPGV